MKLPSNLIECRVKVTGHTHLGDVCETLYAGLGRKRKLVECRARIDGKLLHVTPDMIERTEKKKTARKK